MQMPARTPAHDGDDGRDARPALRRPRPARPRHVRASGRRRVARGPVGQAARSHTRVRRDRPSGTAAADRRAPRRALRHPLLRRRRHRPRQAAQADPEAASPRGADLPRRARPQERRPRRRDRRRLAADLLLAVPLPRAPRPVARARARGVPGRAALRRPRRRRRPAVPRHAEADARPLHRGDGREGEELLQLARAALRLRGGRREDPGALPLRDEGRGGDDRAGRARRRDRARRAEGADRRTARGVARGGCLDAA